LNLPVEVYSLELEVVADHPAASRFDPTMLRALARHVLTAEGVIGDRLVTVALVDDEALRGLHDRFMNTPTVTDVMTFPYQPDLAGSGTTGGDIVISLDRAWEQGPRHGLDGQRETLFLFVHGLLHLTGWDDATPPQRTAMLRRQEELLESFER
jgi:probable rRNA maturation factor